MANILQQHLKADMDTLLKLDYCDEEELIIRQSSKRKPGKLIRCSPFACCQKRGCVRRFSLIHGARSTVATELAYTKRSFLQCLSLFRTSSSTEWYGQQHAGARRFNLCYGFGNQMPLHDISQASWLNGLPALWLEWP